MLMTIDPISSRQATPRPIPSPGIAEQPWWFDTISVLIGITSFSVDSVENVFNSVDANPESRGGS